MARDGVTVVEHSPHHHKFKGLSPSTASGIGREKNIFNFERVVVYYTIKYLFTNILVN